jgi:hypothetical protein
MLTFNCVENFNDSFDRIRYDSLRILFGLILTKLNRAKGKRGPA